MRALFGIFLLSTCALAGTIFDNGAPITDPNSACAPMCPEITTQVGTASFTLGSDATGAGVEFWTFQLPGSYNNGMLNWQIRSDNSGSPASLLGSGTFALSQSEITNDVSIAGYGLLGEYLNVFTIGSLSFHAQQTYYLDIFDVSRADSEGVFWATSGQNSLAFAVDGANDIPINDVPEPTTFLLLGGGLVGVFAQRRWSQNRVRSFKS